MKKLLVILQNAWGVEEGYIPSFRRESFINSQTGRRLKEMLPENCVIEIRNTTPEIGDDADSLLEINFTYLEKQIEEVSPDVILACGRSAKKAIKQVDIKVPVVETFHPAYRALSKEITGNVKNKLGEYLDG